MNEEFCNLWGNMSVDELDQKLLDNYPIVLKWSKERFETVNEKIERLKNEAMKWEMEAEKRTSSESEQEAWMEARKSWIDKENNLK
ncbi:hypothetical protein Tco_1276768, partial [Tanacetum coccineum]